MDSGLASHHHQPSGHQWSHQRHHIRGTSAGAQLARRRADQHIGQRDPRRPRRSQHQRAGSCGPHYVRPPRLHHPGARAVWCHPCHPGCRRHIHSSAAPGEDERGHLNPAGARQMHHRGQWHGTDLYLHHPPLAGSLGNYHHGAQGIHGGRAVSEERTDLTGGPQAGGHGLIATPCASGPGPDAHGVGCAACTSLVRTTARLRADPWRCTPSDPPSG